MPKEVVVNIWERDRIILIVTVGYAAIELRYPFGEHLLVYCTIPHPTSSIVRTTIVVYLEKSVASYYTTLSPYGRRQ